jgi:hypothetical protein
MEEGGRGLIEVQSAYPWKDWVKQRKQFKIADVRAEIRVQHLPNMFAVLLLKQSGRFQRNKDSVCLS